MEQVSFEKRQPANIEAEEAIIAAMVLDKEVINNVVQLLNASDFYREENGILFETIASLSDRGEVIELLTIAEELRKKNLLEKTGGLSEIARIANSTATTQGVDRYAEIVKERSTLRQLIRINTQLLNRCYEESEDVEGILDDAERQILEISKERESSGLVPIKGVVNDVISKLEELYDQKTDITGVPSGFVDLDKMTSGFQRSDLIIVAARPGMGKTSFCLNIAQNVATKKDLSAAVFSLEMSKEQLVQRIISSAAAIDQTSIRTGKIKSEEWSRLIDAVSPLSEAKIYIDDTPAISIREIRAKARRLKAEKGLDILFVDYIQLMTGGIKTESRQQEISYISRSLKALARELNIPIIALSQLSRAAEQSQDKRPSLSHLRESGALEQDADIVMFIYREEYYDPESEKKAIAEIIIAKHRNGPVGSVDLAFFGEYTRFGNLSKK
ncbi:MAG: replicative DNA helicase [Clostridia bacterium]|jgi:replicative DNA helicase|nr:replicative DNA helicase [Clostridia bacterium]